jgi:hypothetical protein
MMLFALPAGGCVSVTLLLVAVVTICAPADADQLRLRQSGNTLAGKPLFDWDAHTTLQCGFLTPNEADNDRSGLALAYYATNDSLFMGVGKEGAATVKVMEISTPDCGTTTALGSMVRATRLQAANDLVDGNHDKLNGADLSPVVDTAQFRNRGLLVSGSTLFNTGYSLYDATGDQVVSHFTHSLTLNANTFGGWVGMWDSTKSRHVSGPMVDVPSYAQAALGGSVLTTGAPNASIIGHLSVGFAAFAFTPADLISAAAYSVVSATPLMYFTIANPMVAGYDTDEKLLAPNTIWNRATFIGGCVIPTGYRSLVCLGTHGATGWYCYGEPTTTEALHMTIKEAGPPVVYWCYDLSSDASTGDHAFPYRYQWWAFDLSDLAAVKAGTKLHYEVDPYDWGAITFPETPAESATIKTIGGIGYDAANKTIYVAQYRMDNPDTVAWPIIWKFTHP